MTKTILKAILLWFTMIYSMCYIGAVDSLSLTGLFIGFVIGAALIYTCAKIIKEEDLDTLLLNNLFKKIV